MAIEDIIKLVLDRCPIRVVVKIASFIDLDVEDLAMLLHKVSKLLVNTLGIITLAFAAGASLALTLFFETLCVTKGV